MGTAPAFVAVSRMVAVVLFSSQEDVESTNIMLLAESWLCARRMMGVTTRAAQEPSAALSVET